MLARWARGERTKYGIIPFCLWQLQLSGEELHSLSERDSTGGMGSGGSEAASPLTARSLRLERVVQALANSQEELRRYVLAARAIGPSVIYPEHSRMSRRSFFAMDGC